MGLTDKVLDFHKEHSLPPGYWSTERERALNKFTELGLPTRKQEEWKYTSVKPLNDYNFQVKSLDAQLLTAEKSPELFARVQKHLNSEFLDLVFINGQYVESLSSNIEESCRSYLKVTPLNEYLRKFPNAEDLLSLKQSEKKSDAFEELNRAYIEHGVVIQMEKDQSYSKPIRILHYTSLESGPSRAVHFSIFVELKMGSQLTVCEEYCGQEGARYFVNSVTQIHLAANSNLSYSRLVQDSLTSYNIGKTRAYLQATSNLNSLALSMGSMISRHNFETYLLGEGATAKINGAYAVDKDQHVDNHTLIDHVVGNCQTSQAYKGILNGHSRAVFNGEVHIRHGALKASSEQINNNLLLSNNAEADSKPELKIYADDVKATHGSTVGALNPDEIFYLQSRAIPKPEAIKILSLGFLTDVIYQFNNNVLEDYLIKVMSDYYNKIQGA